MEKLKNNHESMKTIVETFLIEETIDLLHDNEQLEQWNKYVEDLGLNGQKTIAKKDKSPIPFMHLKKSFINICEELCPSSLEVSEYSLTPIPVEILSLIALSKKENYFTRIIIRYDDKSPDPFAIGIKRLYSAGDANYIYDSPELAAASTNGAKDAKSLQYYYRENQYLIGKWADVKRSWKELKEMAIERYKERKGVEFKRMAKDAERGLSDLEITAIEHFS